MLKGESWGRGSGQDAGTERGVHGGAARKEKGADLCTAAQRTRANEGNGSARRRGTRIGNADERRGFYSRKGKEGQKEGDRAVALCREWVEAERGWSVGRRALRRG
ncbi:hypothetical protein BC826DRAFT_976023 [Russula brevipes]|nr:hypothetical protein BC826DRAFT_1181858 [Russula brevipes]KAI0279153.1 hypothetical protein BC826DRAFT_976023 [Russula brevipes]